jgi:hypothetical protein
MYARYIAVLAIYSILIPASYSPAQQSACLSGTQAKLVTPILTGVLAVPGAQHLARSCLR